MTTDSNSPSGEVSETKPDPIREIAERAWWRKYGAAGIPHELHEPTENTITFAAHMIRLAFASSRQSFRQRTTGLYATDMELCEVMRELMAKEGRNGG